jgi:ribose 5-phosphate isomerase A
MIVISDKTNDVAQLGGFPLPVEIVPFGWETTRAIIEESLESFNVMGRNVTLRLDRNDPYVTDCGHYILDLHLRRIASASELARMLNQIPGVVEHGLFVDMADRIVIGYPTGDTRLIDADGENVGEPEAAEDDTPENLFKVSED